MRKSRFTESQIVAILKGRRSRSRTQRVDQEAWDQPCDVSARQSKVVLHIDENGVLPGTDRY
jgi:hypothetical protein